MVWKKFTMVGFNYLFFLISIVYNHIMSRFSIITPCYVVIIRFLNIIQYYSKMTDQHTNNNKSKLKYIVYMVLNRETKIRYTKIKHLKRKCLKRVLKANNENNSSKRI